MLGQTFFFLVVIHNSTEYTMKLVLHFHELCKYYNCSKIHCFQTVIFFKTQKSSGFQLPFQMWIIYQSSFCAMICIFTVTWTGMKKIWRKFDWADKIGSLLYRVQNYFGTSMILFDMGFLSAELSESLQ